MTLQLKIFVLYSCVRVYFVFDPTKALQALKQNKTKALKLT